MTVRTLGILHPGQMGAAVAAQAVRTGARVLWCPAGRSAASEQRAARAGLEAVPDLADLLGASDVLLSICPPAAAEDVARTVADLGFHGVYVEANAISPARLARIELLLRGPGGRLVDGGIIGPPPGPAARTRLYLAGDPADTHAVAEPFAATAVDVVTLPGPAGAASALKMAFASYQKATRTLAAVAHALADRYHVDEHLLAEAALMAGRPLAETDYLPSVAARAWRWSPEMLEVAETLRTSGLPDDLARATAVVLAQWDGDRDRFDLAPRDVLDRLTATAGTTS